MARPTKGSKEILKARNVLALKSVELVELGIKKALDGDSNLLLFFLRSIIGKNGLAVKPNIKPGDTTKEQLEKMFSFLQKSGTSTEDLSDYTKMVELQQKGQEIEELRTILDELEAEKKGKGKKA